MLAEINRNRKKRSQPFTPADFMPGSGKKEPMDPEQLKTMLRAAFGGKSVKRKTDKKET